MTESVVDVVQLSFVNLRDSDIDRFLNSLDVVKQGTRYQLHGKSMPEVKGNSTYASSENIHLVLSYPRINARDLLVGEHSTVGLDVSFRTGRFERRSIAYYI